MVLFYFMYAYMKTTYFLNFEWWYINKFGYLCILFFFLLFYYLPFVVDKCDHSKRKSKKIIKSWAFSLHWYLLWWFLKWFVLLKNHKINSTWKIYKYFRQLKEYLEYYNKSKRWITDLISAWKKWDMHFLRCSQCNVGHSNFPNYMCFWKCFWFSILFVFVMVPSVVHVTRCGSLPSGWLHSH